MKKITLTILIGLIGMNVFAQDSDNSPKKETKKKHPIVRPDHCAPIYITTSTGINNNTAILGFSFDVPISTNVCIEAGPGTGTWGNKLYIGATYFLKPCHRGFAFGTGITYCPGVYHDWHDVQTIYGYNENEEFNKNPQTNILFAAYRYWYLGKKYNRVYAELGWSMLLTSGARFKQLSGDPISSSSANALDSNAPGGLIAAVGISFGMH